MTIDLENADDLGVIERAIVREKAIRSAMARTGEGREVVAQMIDAMASMDEEAVLELTEGAPTTMRDAIARYIRIVSQKDYGRDFHEDETGTAWETVASDLDAILEYPWAAEEEFLASHAGNHSMALHVERGHDESGALEKVTVSIGNKGPAFLSASSEHHTEAGLEAIASVAGHVHRAVLARVIGDREHHVQLSQTDRWRLLEWLKWPNGSWTGGKRLTVEAVAGGGILVRTRPYTYEGGLAAEQMRPDENARRITDSDVIRALHES